MVQLYYVIVVQDGIVNESLSSLINLHKVKITKILRNVKASWVLISWAPAAVLL